MESPLADATGSTAPPPTVPRACDACRARKIRCNREVPCAHCLHAKIECGVNLETRAKEKRARILLTPQYEKKIDHIDRRLDGVIRLLEDLRAQLPPKLKLPEESSPEPAGALSAKAPSSIPSPASHASHDSTTNPLVEGDSSLTAHSVFANDLLRKIVDQDSSLDMQDTVDTLRVLVDAMKRQPAANEMTYPNAKVVLTPAAATLRACQLPPIQKTVYILKFAKSGSVTPMAWIYELFPVNMFPEICMRVYFSDDYTLADFIIVNSGLHALFWAHAHLVSPPDREEYEKLSFDCAANMGVALANLPLHLPANNDYIMALVSGAFYAVELTKPTLGWVLIAKASELCQTLGYHRLESYEADRPDEARHKQFLFWSVYTLEKGLSLRLGRCSTIQDYDITVPHPVSDDPRRMTIFEFTTAWVECARIQGQIYERLYCPEAIRQPESTRRARVQALAESLEKLETYTTEVYERFHQWCSENVGEDLTKFFDSSDRVLRLSLLTTCYRATPNPTGSPTTFSPECIRAARETLDLHQECMAMNDKGNLGLLSTYLNWTILFSPFVPFVVLFCQVIETHDRADLSRLQAFVASTTISTPQGYPVNEDLAKSHKLFQVLCNIATHYVDRQEAKDWQTAVSTGAREIPASGQAGVSDGIDAYLATLGFPPQNVADHHQPPNFVGTENHTAEESALRGVNPMLWMGNGAQLEDWFYNNQQMMEFLEDGGPGFN